MADKIIVEPTLPDQLSLDDMLRESATIIKRVLLDFDGTIADTLEISLRALNRLAERYKFRRVEESEVAGLRGVSYRELVQILGIPVFRIPQLLLEGQSMVRSEVVNAKPFEGIDYVLSKLADYFGVGILTSNSKENVEGFLSNNSLTDYVGSINTGSIVWGKVKGLRKILRENNLVQNQLIYVDDEIRGVHAAKKAGVLIISVDWGYNRREALERENPGGCISRPDELFLAIYNRYLALRDSRDLRTAGYGLR